MAAIAATFALTIARLLSQAPQPKPSFDVVSVKPSPPFGWIVFAGAGRPGLATAGTPDTVASLFTANQDLGLKLEPGKGPVQVFVINSVEKPTLD